MSEPSIEGRRSRLVAIDKLLQFVDACIHMFLRNQCVYPNATFGPHKRFGRTVLLCDSYPVRQYTKQFCKSIRTLILLDRVSAVWVLSGVHRLVIEIPNDFGRAFYYAIPPTESRSDLEISSLCVGTLSDSFGVLERRMGSLQGALGESPDSSWTLQVETKPKGADNMELPSGFLVQESAVSTADFTLRRPLSSSVVGPTVVLSVSVDKSC